MRLEDGEVLATLAAASLALGIDSARAPLFALRAARALAALAGRHAIAEEDVILSVRLVLGPRATLFPAPPEAEQEAPEDAPPPPPPPPEPEFRRPHFSAAPPEACRDFVRRRFDPDGAPVLRRVRICDEPAFERGLPPPPPEDDPPRRWGGPRW